jgi:hypothetical protein
MEITAEHLQRVFDEIEERAIKCCKKGIEYDITLSTAWSMRTRLLAVLKAKSEEDLMLSKMIGKDLMEILITCNGDMSSLKYTCGHGIDPSIIYRNADSVKNYSEWGNDIEGLCIECWIMKKIDQEKCDEKLL